MPAKLTGKIESKTFGYILFSFLGSKLVSWRQDAQYDKGPHLPSEPNLAKGP